MIEIFLREVFIKGFFVFVELWCLWKGFVVFVIGERFFFCVGLDMVVKSCGFGEGLWVKFVFEWFFVRMNDSMCV